MNPERLLTEREKAALDFTRQLRPPPPQLSPDTEARMFALFIQGTDCVEIARLNKGMTLGQIVRARIDSRWDEKRQEHLAALLNETRMRLQQTTLESVEFITLQLAAAHKLYGDAVKKFLQTGDPADLGGFSIHGWKNYREAIEILKAVTGQDGKTQKHVGEIKHTHEVSPTAPLPPVNRALTTIEAKAVVKSAISDRKK